MKTTITAIIIFLLLFFVACDDEQVKQISDADMQNLTFKDDELLQFVTNKLDSPFFKSESESDDIVNISYAVLSVVKSKNDGDFDYWQTPEETWQLKTGDCEDIALIIAYCCKQILNIEPDVTIINKSDNNGKTYVHAIIFYNGFYYDFGNVFGEKELDILYAKDYYYALAVAQKYHTNWW